jgi:signal transduction histidine kinase
VRRPETKPPAVSAANDDDRSSSRRVLARAQKRRPQEGLTAIVELLPSPAMIVAASGRVLQVNPAMQQQMDRGTTLARRSFSALFPDYGRALDGAPPWLTAQEVDVVRAGPHGTVHETVYVRPLRNRSLIIVTDHTRLRGLEQSHAQNARLASLGFLLASVSHEMNNPLSAISSMAQILQSKRGVSSDVRRQGIELIADSARRLLLIARKLTTFTRIDDTVRVEFSIDTVIEEAFLQLRTDSLGETIDFEHTADCSALVVGYRDQLQQVFFNLFLNAAQAMKGRGTLSVTTERARAEVVVSVTDTGPGISTPNLDRVFQPFFTTKPRGEGLGLGLAITSEIVEQHGGKITVSNDISGSARFELRLPSPPASRAT